jgi:hypothetical protein
MILPVCQGAVANLSVGSGEQTDQHTVNAMFADFCSGGQNDDFRPLTYTLGGTGMGCRDKYVTSCDPS